MISGAQARAARAMVRLTVSELANAAQVAPNTIVRFEADKGVNASSLTAIRRALEGRGIEFTNGDKPGVRLHSAPLPVPLVRPARIDGILFELPLPDGTPA